MIVQPVSFPSNDRLNRPCGGAPLHFPFGGFDLFCKASAMPAHPALTSMRTLRRPFRSGFWEGGYTAPRVAKPRFGEGRV